MPPRGAAVAVESCREGPVERAVVCSSALAALRSATIRRRIGHVMRQIVIAVSVFVVVATGDLVHAGMHCRPVFEVAAPAVRRGDGRRMRATLTAVNDMCPFSVRLCTNAGDSVCERGEVSFTARPERAGGRRVRGPADIDRSDGCSLWFGVTLQPRKGRTRRQRLHAIVHQEDGRRRSSRLTLACR